MGNDKTPSQGGASQTDIDAKVFKVLYELELRLGSKFEQARQQNKEDTQQIVELAVNRAVQPLLVEIQGVKEQVKEGNRRLDDGNKRFDDQSSRITRATAIASQAKDEIAAARLQMAASTTEHQFAPQDPNVPPADKSSGGWISVKEIAPIITAIGSLIAVLMASFAVYRTPSAPADPPASVTSPSPRVAPTQPATPTP
jgi:hypothetical protein